MAMMAVLSGIANVLSRAALPARNASRSFAKQLPWSLWRPVAPSHRLRKRDPVHQLRADLIARPLAMAALIWCRARLQPSSLD